MIFLLGYAIIGLLWFIYEMTHQSPKQLEHARNIRMYGWRARVWFTLFLLFIFLPLTVVMWPFGIIGLVLRLR